jgi:hypothetical protein
LRVDEQADFHDAVSFCSPATLNQPRERANCRPP